MLICEARCGRGAVRRENQDNLAFDGRWRDTPDDWLFSASARAEAGLFAVCDGMGGEAFGAESSLLAAKTLAVVSPEEFSHRGARILTEINDRICHLMRVRKTRIGTTFAGLWLRVNQAGVLNLGDSRVYRLHCGKMEQLSRDHTQTQQLLDMGIVTPEQAAAHPGRHQLTQHLGIFPEELIIQPYDTGSFPVEIGDQFLLCSDGLTDMLSEPELYRVLSSDFQATEKADRMYQAAVERGGKDNITVILVQVV